MSLKMLLTQMECRPYLRADVDGRQFACERWRERPLVRRLRVVDGEAAQLLVPGVLADEAVDVVLAVLLLGLF